VWTIPGRPRRAPMLPTVESTSPLAPFPGFFPSVLKTAARTVFPGTTGGLFLPRSRRENQERDGTVTGTRNRRQCGPWKSPVGPWFGARKPLWGPFLAEFHTPAPAPLNRKCRWRLGAPRQKRWALRGDDDDETEMRHASAIESARGGADVNTPKTVPLYSFLESRAPTRPPFWGYCISENVNPMVFFVGRTLPVVLGRPMDPVVSRSVYAKELVPQKKKRVPRNEAPPRWTT